MPKEDFLTIIFFARYHDDKIVRWDIGHAYRIFVAKCEGKWREHSMLSVTLRCV